MPHLWVQDTVEQASIDHSPTPDPRAYCDIEEGIKALGSSPALLSERRSVHISVERDREAQSTAERPHHVSVGPAGLRRRGDEAKRGGVRARVEWSKGGNPQGP
jgi:hypothetical protein